MQISPFNKIIAFSSRQRNANMGQKKSLNLQTKEMFCAFKGIFFCIFMSRCRNTKMLKQQEEEEKQKKYSYS